MTTSNVRNIFLISKRKKKILFLYRKIPEYKNRLNIRPEKNKHPLSERLAYLGIIGDPIKGALKPLNMIECCDGPGGSRGPLFVPHDTEKPSTPRRDTRLIAVVIPVEETMMSPHEKLALSF